jgi:hypothetical protein
MVRVADALTVDIVYCGGEETGDLRVIAMPQMALMVVGT